MNYKIEKFNEEEFLPDWLWTVIVLLVLGAFVALCIATGGRCVF